MDTLTHDALTRIAEALERISPPPAPPPNLDSADAYVWHPGDTPAHDALGPVRSVNRIDLDLLQGIDRARDTLLDNTRRFARGMPANNVLLWGARGMGKSSLVKAAHAAVNTDGDDAPLLLVEVLRDDIPTLHRLLAIVRQAGDRRFIMFCDDLSFDRDDTHYKSLKAALDGGVEGRPANALFYATSNRRHLMPRDMIENEQRVGINPGEATEEKVSLSDRFGLWLGFHPCDQTEFLAMIRGYCDAYRIGISDDDLHAEAIRWRQSRGAVSGRVAWQFIQDLAGRRGITLERPE